MLQSLRNAPTEIAPSARVTNRPASDTVEIHRSRGALLNDYYVGLQKIYFFRERLCGGRWRKNNSTSVFFRSMASEKMSNRSRIDSIGAENRPVRVAARPQKWSRFKSVSKWIFRIGLPTRGRALGRAGRPGQGAGGGGMGGDRFGGAPRL